MTEAPEGSARHFVENILPLYHGPLVKIRIKPGGREYACSKGLLCAKSPVFSAMFEGQFLESKELTATVEEMEGVVSERSFEALFQWLYLHVVDFGIKDPVEHISASMELVRLADKYRILELEGEMAHYIKDIIVITNSWSRHIDTNTDQLTSDHVISAAVLHREHPVRRLLAAASVEGYLRSEHHKFADLYKNCPSVAADLLREVRLALNGVKSSQNTQFKDPISGISFGLNEDQY